jgi:hypothetical protein
MLAGLKARFPLKATLIFMCPAVFAGAVGAAAAAEVVVVVPAAGPAGAPYWAAASAGRRKKAEILVNISSRVDRRDAKGRTSMQEIVYRLVLILPTA